MHNGCSEVSSPDSSQSPSVAVQDLGKRDSPVHMTTDRESSTRLDSDQILRQSPKQDSEDSSCEISGEAAVDTRRCGSNKPTAGSFFSPPRRQGDESNMTPRGPDQAHVPENSSSRTRQSPRNSSVEVPERTGRIHRDIADSSDKVESESSLHMPTVYSGQIFSDDSKELVFVEGDAAGLIEEREDDKSLTTHAMGSPSAPVHESVWI